MPCCQRGRRSRHSARDQPIDEFCLHNAQSGQKYAVLGPCRDLPCFVASCLLCFLTVSTRLSIAVSDPELGCQSIRHRLIQRKQPLTCTTLKLNCTFSSRVSRVMLKFSDFSFSRPIRSAGVNPRRLSQRDGTVRRRWSLVGHSAATFGLGRKDLFTPFGHAGVNGVVHGRQQPVSRAGVRKGRVGTPDFSLIQPALETCATSAKFGSLPRRHSAIDSTQVWAIPSKTAPLDSATSPTRGATVIAASNRNCRSFICYTP